MTRQVKERGGAFWDANPCGGEWESYGAFLNWIHRTEPYAFAIIEAHDWQGLRVLDIGCGQGTILNHLPPLGATAVGLDVSGTSLQRARHGARELGHLERVVVSRGDAERLPFADASFDAVVSFGVLHHTPDTAAGVREIRRVLRPGGRALVMLYRSGNPKWWATRVLRGGARIADRMVGRRDVIAGWLRARQKPADPRGTALLELFGCPILTAFSNRQVLRMFEGFAHATIANVQPGFRRLRDIVPMLRPLDRVLAWVDRITENRWGFYQIVTARR